MRLLTRRSLVRWPATSGSSLVEFALVLPMLFVMFINVVNFGSFFHAWIAVASAARTGADYMIMGGASVRAPGVSAIPPTGSQVQALVLAATSVLPNSGSVVVRVCSRTPSTNSVIVCDPGTEGDFPNPPPEDAATRPEEALYVLTWIDVKYTYQPPFPVLTILPSRDFRLHSTTRMIQ
jgi:hypothetical protein